MFKELVKAKIRMELVTFSRALHDLGEEKASLLCLSAHMTLAPSIPMPKDMIDMFQRAGVEPPSNRRFTGEEEVQYQMAVDSGEMDKFVDQVVK